MSPADVRDVFDYRDDGVLLWAIRPAKRIAIGTPAGRVNRRRPCDRGRDLHVITFKGRTYTRGQLVFAWHYGVWPDRVLGHANGDTLDDRVENLRVADVQLGRGETCFTFFAFCQAPRESRNSSSVIFP